jgi:alkylation response protein AidB-like acyl-CoA dehydrogenase
VDFSASEKIRNLRALVRAFVEKEVVPLEPKFLNEGWAAVAPALEDVRRRARATGLFAAPLPAEWGGAGLPLAEFAHMSEELGRSPLGPYAFNVQAPDVGNMELLLAHGTQEQKERWLRPLVEGRIRSCFTMTEPEFAGSNPVWMGTTATREGDAWVLRGHKWFASSADGAAFAVCMAVTDAGAEPHRRASLVLVPTDTPGFSILRNISVMGHRGGGWASHAEIGYEGARVPLANLIGREGEGFALAQERLGPGRIHHAMRWIGVMERSLEIMCRHAVTRELAPGTPLGTRQLVEAAVAETRADVHAARLVVLHAAWRLETEGAKAAREDISLVKVVAARALQRVLDRALQTLGGLGMTDDTPLAFWYAHERAARIYDGPDEVHLSFVGHQTLRRFGLAPRG